jgi:signal peptidase I
MPDNYLETKNELLGPLVTEKPKKKRNPWGVVLRVFLLLVLIVSLSITALLLYVKINYPDSIFVQGLSMYPLLNSTALRAETQSDGSIVYKPLFANDNGTYNLNRTNHDGDIVDYGYSDPREGTLNSLKRFDIVLSYYPEDYGSDGKLLPTADAKIKRVIGLPGETVRLDMDNSPMARLKINGEVVEQPGNTFENYNRAFLSAGIETSYPASILDPLALSWTGREVKLGEDEYYLAGDNRYGSASKDSRTIGPVKRKMLKARFAMVIAQAKIKENGTRCDLIYSSLKWPWQVQPL